MWVVLLLGLSVLRYRYYICSMQQSVPQSPEVLNEIERLKVFFETHPILLREWKEGCMMVKDIPQFIQLQLNAAATFNPQHWFNPPLKRLQRLEEAIRNQVSAR